MVAGKKTKCHECNIVDEQEKIIDGENPKKRYHATCSEVARKKKEFLKKEKEQKDELFNKLLKIHGLRNSQEIPRYFYQRIEEVRNDATYFGNVVKKYKEGIPYSGINYAYDYCSERIDGLLRFGKFESKLHEMLACLKLIGNNFSDAREHAIRQMKQKEDIKKQLGKDSDTDMSLEQLIKNNKKDSMDISDLL